MFGVFYFIKEENSVRGEKNKKWERIYLLKLINYFLNIIILCCF